MFIGHYTPGKDPERSQKSEITGKEQKHNNIIQQATYLLEL